MMTVYGKECHCFFYFQGVKDESFGHNEFSVETNLTELVFLVFIIFSSLGQRVPVNFD